MESSIFFVPSLVVAFISGLIALFAPCCISFLLPAYLGQIFQRRIKIVIGTLIFSLGIAVVMLPVVLGVRSIVMLFNEYHAQTYVVGGLIMIFAGLLFLGVIKLPMFLFHRQIVLDQKAGYGSIFMLGITSGLASSCCAPVLVAALTVASLTATILQALFVGISYVLGMVTPLFISAILMRSDILSGLRRRLEKEVYGVRLGDLIGGVLMIGFGVIVIFLALTGRVVMPEKGMDIGRQIYFWASKLNAVLARYWFIDVLFLILVFVAILALVRVIKKEIKESKQRENKLE